MLDAPVTTRFVAALPPRVTEVAPVKFAPVIAMAVPPVVGPLPGDTLATVGAGTVYVKSEFAGLAPDVVVTTTDTEPGACAGVVQAIVVVLVTTTLVAALPPKVTLTVPKKFVPVMIAEVPPVVRPALGVTPLTVGAGGLL